MKAKNDRHTIELPMPGAKGVAGRPRKPDALSDADRAKRYRDKRRKLGVVFGDGLVARWRQRSEMLEQKLAAKDKEIGLLISERAAAWREIDRLKAKLAQAK